MWPRRPSFDVTVITWMHITGTQVLYYKIVDFSICLAGLESIYPGNESRAWSQLSAGQVLGKIRLLAKSRDRCNYSAWCLYVYTFPSMLRRLSSESFNNFNSFFISYQWPLVIEHALNIRLNNNTSCMDCIHASLVSRITVSIYLCLRIQTSLLPPYRLIISKQLRIKSLNLIWVLFTVLVNPVFLVTWQYN